MDKYDSHYGGVVPSEGDNTTLQPSLQTRQCCLLVTKNIQLYNLSLYTCPGYSRGTTWGGCVYAGKDNDLRHTEGRNTPHKTTLSKPQVDALQCQCLPSTRKNKTLGWLCPHVCVATSAQRVKTQVIPYVYQRC